MKRKSIVWIVAFACMFLTTACVRTSEGTEGKAPSVEWAEDSFFIPESPEEGAEEEIVQAVDAPEEEGIEEGESAVQKGASAEETEEENKPVRYVRSLVDGLNVRTGAGTDYSSLGSLDKGDMVSLIGRNGDWYETRYCGKKAYVSAKQNYTSVYETVRADDAIERVIEVGCALLGTPYVYGATRLHNGEGVFLKKFNENEYDCSSLMQCIFYYGASELLQVTTRTQVSQGTGVDKADIRRGDLLFFTNESRKNKTGIERVGHVALYLGDGYILHTASDHAVIEKISEKRWSYFICARRILDK